MGQKFKYLKLHKSLQMKDTAALSECSIILHKPKFPFFCDFSRSKLPLYMYNEPYKSLTPSVTCFVHVPCEPKFLVILWSFQAALNA